MKLTKSVCDKATYQGKGKKGFYAVWDGELRGFGLRITPSGTKSFIAFYRIGGKQRIITIGRFGVITPDQARKMAQEILVEVNRGNDPVEERKAQDVTFADLASHYLEDYSKVHKKSWKEDQRRLDTRILPVFGKRKIVDISRQEIIKFHQRMGTERGPYEANRIKALLSTMFEYARKIELIPIEHPNPCFKVDKFREEEREVFVNRETELPRLMEILEKEPNIFVRSAILLYLATGMRKTELLTAKWEWIDWERKELRLPDSKSGKPRVIPLPPEAIEILGSLYRVAGNPYIIPSLSHPGKRLWNIDRPWRKIRAAAGLDHVRIHDLRRSFGSWMAQDGKSLFIIGKVLGHADINTTKIYARLTEDPERKAIEETAKVLDISWLRDTKKNKESA